LTSQVITVKLGEVISLNVDAVDVNPAETYQFAGVYSFGRGLFHRGPLVGSETTYKKFHRLHENQFVMSQVKGWEGALARVTCEFEGYYLSPVYPTFSADSAQLDIGYLEHYFKQKKTWDQLERLSTGMGARRNSVYPDMLFSLEIPLPPLDEQRRIVAHIEALSVRIAEARGLRQQAVAEAEAFWYSSLQQTRHELLMGGWEVKQIGELASVTSGGTPSREVSAYWNGEIPWIKTGELIDGDILGAEEFITEDGLNNSSTKLFPIETILIALYGQGQTRGRTGRLMIEAATNQACCAILPTERFDSRFLQYWIRSLYSEMREVAHGGAQPNWNSSTIKRIEVPLLPLSEQHYVVAHLDDLHARVDALKRLQADTAAELDALLPAVLDRAFRGEL